MELSQFNERQSGARRGWRLAMRAIVIRGTVAISAFALTLLSADRWSRRTPPVDSTTPALRVDGSSIVLDETAPQWQALRLGVAAPARDYWTRRFPARFEIDGTRAAGIALAGRKVSPGTIGGSPAAGDPSSSWVVVDLPEALTTRVIEGMEAEVIKSSNPGLRWKGRVQMVSPAGDPGRHTVPIRVSVSTSGRRIRPDLPVEVRFRIAQRSEMPEVPAASLVTDGERQYVYVLTGPDRMTRRAVATGTREGDRVPIVSGLRAGETIVKEGSLLLEDALTRHHDASARAAGAEE